MIGHLIVICHYITVKLKNGGLYFLTEYVLKIQIVLIPNLLAIHCMNRTILVDRKYITYSLVDRSVSRCLRNKYSYIDRTRQDQHDLQICL